MASNANVINEEPQPEPSNNSENPSAEDDEKHLRKLLKLYFYSAFKWKDNAFSIHIIYCVIFLVQIIKVSLITCQLLNFGNARSHFSSNVNRGHLTLKHLLIKDWTATWETLPYPPSTGEFAVYTIADLESDINFAVSRYNNIGHVATGYLVRMEDDNMTVTIKYYDLPRFGDEIEWFETTFAPEMGLSKTVVGNETIFSYNVTKELEYLNISHLIKRMSSAILHFTLHSMRSHENSGLATCMQIKGEVLFTDLDTNGQVDVDLRTLTYRINCASMNIPVKDWQLNEVSTSVGGAVIALCCLSIIITILNAIFGIYVFKKTWMFMKKYFAIYYGTDDNREKNLPGSEYFRFFKFWDILVIMSDILTLTGTVTLIRAAHGKSFILELLDCDAVSLGIGCIFAWFSLLRFFKFTVKFHLLFSTIHRALWDVLAYLVCVVVLFVGFWICGYVVMSPYHVKFSTPEAAAETLFTMINGDEIYATFAILEEQKTGSKGVYVFSRFFIGTFVGIFTIVVINLLIALFMNAYETIQVLFTDRYTSGQVEADIHTLTTKIKCASMNVSVEDWQLETILGRLRIATFIFCGASTLLTICSICFGAFVYWKTKKFMKRHFKTYYGISSNREKDLPQSEYLRFLKFWDILVVASDVLVFLGTEGLKREAERNFILETIDSDTVWLGIGCIFAWFSLLRFLKIHTKFHLLFSTIRYAFWDVFAYLVCVVLLFVGFWVCGYVVMGPYHVKFSTPSDAAETLYALIHGDEVYATFAILEEQKAGGNGVFWFSRFYIGTFVGIFTIVVINLLIALFMNAYETIQEYKKGNTEDSKINALEKALRQYLTSYNDIDNQSSCENNLLSNFYQFLADTNVTSDKAGDLRSELLKLVQVRNGRIEPARRRTLKAFIEEGSQEECFCIIVIPKQNKKTKLYK